MSDTNNTTDILGKKVFFLYPTTSIQNQIVTELVQHEFEVYIVKNHINLPTVLKNNPDSVVFVNIDERMSEQEWEKWITGIHTALPEIKIGVFSARTDDELKEKYTTKLHVTCGFINLKLDMTKTISKILEVLTVLNVKGRRKYLRTDINNDSSANLNIPFNGEYLNGFINDISVVGFACILDNDPGFKKNELIKDIQIKLQSVLLKVEAVVFGSREEGGQKIYVLLFTQRIDPDIRVKIRKYIQGNMQSKMDIEL